MRIMVFGASGMLGHKLIQQLSPKFEVWGTIRRVFNDISGFGIFDESRIVTGVNVEDATAVESALHQVRPDVVINGVGVIKQLPTSKDVEKTLTINSIFPHRLAGLSDVLGYRLITVSTDCVFNGAKGHYRESDLSDATDLYGKSKAIGEVDNPNCLTLRTSIIGRELGTAHSLVEWVLSNRGKKIKGFTNAIYTGFPTIVFADIIGSLVSDHPALSGLYHVASGPISKYDLCGLINTHYGAGIDIEASADFFMDRSLDGSKFNAATGFRAPSWNDMIAEMAADSTPYDNWKA